MALEKQEQASANSEFRQLPPAARGTLQWDPGKRRKGDLECQDFVSQPISYLLAGHPRSALHMDTRTPPWLDILLNGPVRQIQHSLEVPRSTLSCHFLKLCCFDMFWQE